MKNTSKHGIAQVRLYDPYAPGDVSRYLSKRRFSSAADCEGANTYELRKFKSGGLDLYQVQPPGAEMRPPNGGHGNAAAFVVNLIYRNLHHAVRCKQRNIAR